MSVRLLVGPMRFVPLTADRSPKILPGMHRSDNPPRPAPLLDDQPALEDLLNFREFAVALRDVIVNPATRTPFIIGIFGRWGAGKTTLMRMLERELAAARTTTVWFSAWLYGQDKEIWAAFLQSLSSRLADRMRFADKFRFSAGVFRRGLSGSVLLYHLPEYLWRVTLVVAPLLLAAVLGHTLPSDTALALHSGGALTSVALAAWMLLKPMASAARREVRPDFNLYRSVDFDEHVGFLERFRDQFSRIVASLPESGSRVVIFVDDLDRCGPEQALALLDAIKIFLDVPNCVFVLGIDRSIIQQALAKKYPDDIVAQQEYLSKIVQLPFQLPPLTADDLASFLRRLEVELPDERCREVFLAALAPNPREIKRVVNTFSLHWALARARMSGMDVKPVRLAKVVVIQQSYGELFSLLVDRPEWLATLERLVLRRPGSPQSALDTTPAVAAETTVQLGPDGVAVPPALARYLQEPRLERLLSALADTPNAATEVAFSSLSADEIAVYFSLTGRVSAAVPAVDTVKSAEPLAAIDASGASVDFGPRYRVVRQIGRGGTSEVYLAQDSVSGRSVAIKVLLSALANDPPWIARYAREAATLARIPPHPNVVSVIDQGRTSAPEGKVQPYYVMDWVGGDTLQQELARANRLPLRATQRLIGPVFDALAHIHAAGLVHRDLKPSSIGIGADGVPKLLDFGLALEQGSDSDHLTMAGTVLGTPVYMSPEQVLGLPTDARADLYSLGAIVFECLTGSKPYRADSIPALLHDITRAPVPSAVALVPELPQAIDAFLARMLAKQPAERFPDARSAKEAFMAADSPPS
jgi:protein kinase-like protein/KAP-like P-loop domain-containing protein